MLTCTRRISTASIIVLAFLTGACADTNRLAGPDVPRQPAFSASIAAVTAWTASGPGTVTVVSDGTAGDAVMSYELANSPPSVIQLWDFETTADQTATVTLPWSWSGEHGEISRQVMYAVVNDVVVDTLVIDEEDAAFSFSGVYTFTVSAGDTYGFRLGGRSGLFNPTMIGTFTVDLPEGPVNPATKDDCKGGGWAAYGFQSQGQCIALVNTGHDGR